MIAPVRLRADDGRLLPLEPDRWHAAPTPGEQLLLRRIAGPALDVGCGPGRILDLLARRGTVALGVDSSAHAVGLARGRGCTVLQRSVFDRLPMEGQWGSVLLLDGNIGIGGDPARLLGRCGALLHARGSIIAEVEAPPTTWHRCQARLERGDERSVWFPWAVVGALSIAEVAGLAGLHVRSVGESAEGRWFAMLERRAER